MAFELLSAAARAATGAASRGLQPGLLRFSLEFASPPDIAAVRAHLIALLGADGFDLKALPSGEDPQILILEFPGVLRAQSPSYLFKAADELVEEFHLVSCTPDVDPGWLETDELGRDAPESVSGVLRGICESSAPAPMDRHWATKSVRADRVWATHGAQGQGIRIGQPDTGVADHRELDRALNLSAGTNILTGGGAPIDPLSGPGNPGHGTATSSTVVSRLDGLVVGSAPGAELAPIRCVTSVVIDSGAAVAAAIDHARTQGCHIVTMSLGGPIPFPDLKRAIKRAVEADMIILAAAGNCVRLVVYPAWDDRVIAVAGVDANDKPWKGTCRGPAVDISAPAEKVYVASRSTPSDLDRAFVRPGQGTSFAVAITAGCAALWLSHHGLTALKSAAEAKGVTLQQLFRAAVRQTARRPVSWPDDMGAGIVDAEALLVLDPDAIAVSPPAPSGHPLATELGPAFNWDRFGAEAGFLALDRSQREDPTRAAALESPVAPHPTPALTKAVREAGGDPLRLFRAPPIVSPLTPEITPRQAVRLIAAGGLVREGRAESTANVTEGMARQYLQGSGREETLQTVLDALAANTRDDDPRLSELRGVLANAMPTAVDHLAVGGRGRDLVGVPRVAMEALVRMTGRPAWRIKNGAVALDAMGDWVTYIAPHQAQYRRIFDAVGRIDILLDDVQTHVGTGVVVAPGVVMTNRHVLDAIAEPLPGGGFVLGGPASIVFDEDGVDETRRFEVTKVLTAGPDRIGRQADIGKLDMALLAVTPTSSSGAALPDPVSPGVLSKSDHKILVVGYPARPGQAAVTDPTIDGVSIEMIDRLFEIYRHDYGVKYASPGEIAAEPLAGDERGWGFSHDATTLGGNSGSPVISLQQLRMTGLHFGGAPLRQNLAHDLGAVRTAAKSELLIDAAIFDLMAWPK